jgi:hypothetical protein
MPKSRSSLKTTVAILLLTLFCEGAFSASAQGLTNTIPRNQAPLAKTFPPAAAEQTPSGTGKFVIFTREETDKPNEWNFIAGAWECIPSRPNVPVTKRAEFCHSSWEAQLLMNCLVRDDIEGLYQQFVQLMVDTGDRDYGVDLYSINYRTWDVRCVWRGDRLSAFGVMKNFVFCQDSTDWFRIDGASGNIIKDVPFIPLDVDGAFWLVRRIGEKSGVWSYDLAKEQFVGHFSDVDESQLLHSRSLLSKDGRNRSWLLVPKPNDWRDGLVEGTFLLQRDNHAEDIRVPVMLQTKAMRGSGRFNPIGTHLNFTKDGTVEFSACPKINGSKQRVWAIDIATGKITESVRPYIEPREDDLSLFDGVPTPDYLRKHLKELGHFGRGGLAPAFLMHLGILKEQPEFPDCTAGVSRDGSHILYKAKKGKLANVFIYGDLQTKQTVRWACPKGIKPGDSLEFAWVETP